MACAFELTTSHHNFCHRKLEGPQLCVVQLHSQCASPEGHTPRCARARRCPRCRPWTACLTLRSCASACRRSAAIRGRAHGCETLGPWCKLHSFLCGQVHGGLVDEPLRPGHPSDGSGADRTGAAAARHAPLPAGDAELAARRPLCPPDLALRMPVDMSDATNGINHVDSLDTAVRTFVRALKQLK